MNCPKCNCKTSVQDSRKVEMNVYRRRICMECGYKFFTEETEIEDNSALRYYWAESIRKRRSR